MPFRRRGYFPRLEKLLADHDITIADVVAATGLTEKSVRRMASRTGYSLFSSVEKVIEFLNARSLHLQVSGEFAEVDA